MRPTLLLCLLLASCASSKAAELHSAAEVHDAEDRHVTAHDREERGPVVTVIEEEYESESPQTSGALVSAGGLPTEGQSVPPPAPRLKKRKVTKTELPIGPAGPAIVTHHDDEEWARRLTDAKAKLDAKTVEQVKPAAGCAFGAGLLVPVATAAGALLLWKLKPWR